MKVRGKKAEYRKGRDTLSEINLRSLASAACDDANVSVNVAAYTNWEFGSSFMSSESLASAASSTLGADSPQVQHTEPGGSESKRDEPFLAESPATSSHALTHRALLRLRDSTGSSSTRSALGRESSSTGNQPLQPPTLDRLNLSAQLQSENPSCRTSSPQSAGNVSVDSASDCDSSGSRRSPAWRRHGYFKEPLSARIHALAQVRDSKSREAKFLSMVETCIVTKQDNNVVAVTDIFESLYRSGIRRLNMVVVNNFIRFSAIQQYRDSMVRIKQETEQTTGETYNEHNKSMHTVIIGSGPQLLIGKFCESLGLKNVSGIIDDRETYVPERNVTVLADPIKSIYGAFTAWQACAVQSESPRSRDSADVTHRFRSFLELTEPSTSNAKHQFMCFVVLDCADQDQTNFGDGQRPGVRLSEDPHLRTPDFPACQNWHKIVTLTMDVSQSY